MCGALRFLLPSPRTGPGATGKAAQPFSTFVNAATAAASSPFHTAPDTARKSAPAAKPVDRNLLHVQVILDSLGFGPGLLDGKGGQSLTAALKGFQEAKGLPKTGKPDAATLAALYPYRAKRPTARFMLTREALAGPYITPLP